MIDQGYLASSPHCCVCEKVAVFCKDSGEMLCKECKEKDEAIELRKKQHGAKEL